MVSADIDWYAFFDDGLFAAVAAIGFSTISHTPRRAYFICALAAAAAHSLRFLLMRAGGVTGGIVAASALAAFAAGLLAVLLSPRIKVPAEACLFPALLPMIPGMYAYRAVAALAGCIDAPGEPQIMHQIYLLCYNGFTCVAIVIAMVITANIPIFLLKKISFQATR